MKQNVQAETLCMLSPTVFGRRFSMKALQLQDTRILEKKYTTFAHFVFSGECHRDKHDLLEMTMHGRKHEVRVGETVAIEVAVVVEADVTVVMIEPVVVSLFYLQSKRLGPSGPSQNV